MDGNGAFGLLADVQELRQDLIRGRAAVHEVQIVMLEPGGRKLVGVVHLLVQPDDGGHVVPAEVLEVELRRVQRVAPEVPGLVVRPAEAQELARNYPVQVAVFHALKTRFNKTLTSYYYRFLKIWHLCFR